ncbi:DNA-binding NarL/FixJ family response regulator [Streptomyces sp. B3I7]|uniref:response regulator transcription factor n=1 Tax=unclassified Streptomyces TaxID=2593676 RepID=UPI002786C507|nr:MULTISPECIES: response regulator transcription factor [unclassified Streptomyces]MDQ0789344.1 DNA-binding NarL/FixJ family response regulator [Streptomyces sp. B3I8]MDQ0811044.1 DNA-binding NarL/FixJ family response regulator [Streptomyces sp. B3I7]
MTTAAVVGGPALVREAVARVVEGSRLVDTVARAADETRFGELLGAGVRPDVVLLTRTVRDRGRDGDPSGGVIRFAESVATASALARTIVLGVADAPEADTCLRAGATGVLAADITAVQLVAALETVLRGGLVVVLGTAPVVAVPERRRTAGAEVVGTLSLRERQVLTLLASGQEAPAIAAALRISPLTVKTHIAHLLSKLGVSRRGHAIAFAYEHGLVVPGTPLKDTLLSRFPEAS